MPGFNKKKEFREYSFWYSASSSSARCLQNVRHFTDADFTQSSCKNFWNA